MSIQLHGRKKIFTPYDYVDETNLAEILTTSYSIYTENVSQIDYLFAYYKGIQPILFREKKIRPEINNKIVENHAYSIVQFKTGYLLEKPIQYVARKDAVDNASLNAFNDYLEIEGKEAKDKKIANDQAVCGTAYRLVLPNKNYVYGGDESPFNIFTIKPRLAFVVYSTGIGEKPLLGVVIYTRKDGDKEYTVLQAYSKDMFWKFDYTNLQIIDRKPHTMGDIPLIEYPYNEERMGAFETVIPLLEAINKVQSNRVDGVEQFIQALLVFKNVDLEKDDLTKLIELGAVTISDTGELKANVEYLTQELNQEQVQKLKDDLLDIVYRIAGMPNRTATGSGDTGTAVIMRNGWSEAEARTQDVELMFKGSEKQFLKIALSFTRTLAEGRSKLVLSDLEIKFTRRNYENTYQKAQILDTMLKNNKIAPRLAFVTCGLFQDPESAYDESKKYYEEQQAKLPQPQPQPKKEVDPNGKNEGE